jgi:hypothetical protein
MSDILELIVVVTLCVKAACAEREGRRRAERQDHGWTCPYRLIRL